VFRYWLLVLARSCLQLILLLLLIVLSFIIKQFFLMITHGACNQAAHSRCIQQQGCQ
jgi:hypothetical protein